MKYIPKFLRNNATNLIDFRLGFVLSEVTPEVPLQNGLEAVEAPTGLDLHGLALLNMVPRPIGLALGAEATGFAMLLQGSACFEVGFGAVATSHLQRNRSNS